MTAEEYVTTVTNQVRCKKVRPHIARELRDHIQDQSFAHMESDHMDQAAAEIRSVEEMGDPIATGAALDKAHRLHFPWHLMVITVLLFISTIPIMRGLTSLTDHIDADSAALLQLQHIVIGALVCAILGFVDYGISYKLSMIGVVLSCAAFLAACLENLHGYVRLGRIAFAAPSIVPLYLLFYAGAMYHFRYRQLRKLWSVLILELMPFVLLIQMHAVLAAFMLLIGTTGIFSSAANAGLFSLGKRAKTAFRIIPFVIMVVLVMEGLLTYGNVYQPAEAGMSNLSQSWYMSRWVGGSSSAISLLQSAAINPMTDGTFLGIAALWGRLATIGITAILLVLSAGILYFATTQSNYLGKILGTACGYALLLQTILSVVSCFLTKTTLGAGVPVFSFGETGAVVCAILLGMVMSIETYHDITPFEAGTQFTARE